MAISSYSNPIPEIIDGLLRGHQLGLQMQQAARADQEFKTQQAMHNQQMSMQDILNTHTMQEYGARPLGPGDTIQENIKTPSTPFASASPAPPSGQGDLYNLPTGPSPTMPGQSIDYVRKADKSRVTSLQDRFGNKTSYELPTYEEQQRRQVAAYQAQEDAKTQAQIRAMGPLAEAKARIDQQQAQQHRENMLKLYGGRAAPAEFAAIGINPGTVLTRDEWDSALQKYQGFTKPIVAPETSNIYQQDLPGMQTPGAGPAQPSVGAPGQPAAAAPTDQTTIRFPFLTGQAGATPATAAPAAAPGAPAGMRLLVKGKPKLNDQEAYVEAWAQQQNKTTDQLTGVEKLKAITAYKHDPAAQAQAQANWEQAHALGVQAAGAREQAHQDTLTNQQRSALDRESNLHSKQFDEISKGADSQLDKILDAEKMVAGGAIQQALGIPKVLTALISGQGSGVRITKDEMGSIAKARGIGGDIEGFFNKISGQGSLTTQQKDQLQAILGDVRERILQKKAIARQASDEIMNAPNRAGVLGAVKKGRDALDAYSTQQGAPQKTLPTGHKVGDVVTVKGKQYTIGTVHPDGSWDPK